MTRSTGFSLFVLILMTLFGLVGCDPTAEIDEATVAETSGRIVAEELGIERADDVLEWQAADVSASVDEEWSGKEEAPEQDPDCYWTRGFVTFQGVTVIDTVLVCGTEAFVRLPRTRDTIGLPFTMRLMDGTTFHGTVQ